MPEDKPRRDELIRTIKKQVGEELTEEQISQVLAVHSAVTYGDPLGMVRRDPESGRVAHRVEEQPSAIQMWRVTSPDGEQYNDMEATLNWPVLYDPTADAVET